MGPVLLSKACACKIDKILSFIRALYVSCVRCYKNNQNSFATLNEDFI